MHLNQISLEYWPPTWILLWELNMQIDKGMTLWVNIWEIFKIDFLSGSPRGVYCIHIFQNSALYVRSIGDDAMKKK